MKVVRIDFSMLARKLLIKTHGAGLDIRLEFRSEFSVSDFPNGCSTSRPAGALADGRPAHVARGLGGPVAYPRRATVSSALRVECGLFFVSRDSQRLVGAAGAVQGAKAGGGDAAPATPEGVSRSAQREPQTKAAEKTAEENQQKKPERKRPDEKSRLLRYQRGVAPSTAVA